jgi:hypothetical protein
MKRMGLLLLSMAAAALAPLIAKHDVLPADDARVREWPHEFRGHPLVRVPLDDDEQRFLKDFPGAVARFSDGEHDIIMRWVDQPTRRLHPAEDCYRGWGYELSESKIRADGDGTQWRCFTARNGGRERSVCEQLRDLEGAHFTDVSSWYWSATLGRTTGPWLVTTVSR